MWKTRWRTITSGNQMSSIRDTCNRLHIWYDNLDQVRSPTPILYISQPERRRVKWSFKSNGDMIGTILRMNAPISRVIVYLFWADEEEWEKKRGKWELNRSRDSNEKTKTENTRTNGMHELLIKAIGCKLNCTFLLRQI